MPSPSYLRQYLQFFVGRLDRLIAIDGSLLRPVDVAQDDFS